jgi:hypothetical protein
LLLHAIVHADDIQDRDCGILVIFADGGYQGPKFNQALARVLPYLKAEKAFRLGQGICGLAQTLDRRAYVRLAQSVPQARQGLGKPHSQGAGVLAPHLNPPPERSHRKLPVRLTAICMLANVTKAASVPARFS